MLVFNKKSIITDIKSFLLAVYRSFMEEVSSASALFISLCALQFLCNIIIIFFFILLFQGGEWFGACFPCLCVGFLWISSFFSLSKNLPIGGNVCEMDWLPINPSFLFLFLSTSCPMFLRSLKQIHCDPDKKKKTLGNEKFYTQL